MNDLDWTSVSSKLVNYEHEVKMKALNDLTIDEAILFRPDDFFPRGDDKRSYKIAARVDGSYRRTLKILTRAHPRTVRGNNQFLLLALGSLLVWKDHAAEIEKIEGLFNKIESGVDDFAYDRCQKRYNISQSGPVAQVQIGLTMSGQNSFEDLAEMIGVSLSSMVVACFWKSALTSSHLPNHLNIYGENILLQFDKHLKSRLYELSYSMY